MDINRREFVKAGVLGLGLVAIPKLVLAQVDDGVFKLSATKTQHSLVEGVPSSELWLFNGVMSGPEIRVKQGSEITVIFKNELDEPTSVHWHGIRIINSMDGVSGLTQDAVQPGEEFIYKFIVPDAGSFWYHAHNMSWSHVARGLYGALIVDEAVPTFDRAHDITVLIDDWRLDQNGVLDVASLGNLMEWAHDGRIGNFLTVNGEFRPEIKLNVNENYRIRIINVANSRVLAIDPNQLGAKVIAYDGQTLAEPRVLTYDPLILGPAQRVDLLLTPSSKQPIDLMNFGGNEPYKMMSFTVVGQEKVALDPPRLIRHNLPEPVLEGAMEFEVKIQGGAMRASIELFIYKGKTLSPDERVKTKQVWALNGVAGMAEKPMFDVENGQTVILNFINDTSFIHAMHVHGHHFKILQRGGQDDEEMPWKDTFMVGPDSTTKIAFVADNVGKWLLHCHMLEHTAAGMVGWFDVREV